ncbi:MAG TPA: F0F1 ATP synthase subunit A [Bryobacteraceae bacterium]|nr:F0F1 ATP synthase subunit A [Bryobacteraceae bacterium]
MTHDVWLTKIFNTYLAGAGNALLALFKQTAENPREPWSDHVVMEILVAVLMMVLLVILRSRLSVQKPGVTQHIFEAIHKFVVGEAEDQVGHEGHHHTTIFMTLFLFILLGNLIGLIPGFISPTQYIYVTVGCALISFVYYNIVGLKKNGLWKYTKHFFGPIPLMAPLMLPIEIVSHLARPLSLSIRLFANMYAGEKVTMTFLGLTYLIVPTVFMGLHVFVALLQAYIFMLMTIIYVAGAVAEEH